MQRVTLLLIFLWVELISPAYSQRADYTVDSLEENKHLISSVELSPDNKTLGIATAEGHILFWDIGSRKITQRVEVSGFRWGAYINYSSDGKYLLLQQQYFTDWRINKDRPSTAAVLDVATGKVILTVDAANFASLTPDNNSIAALQGDEIIFRNILSGEVEKRFKPQNVTNAFAISPDGNTIAVSQSSTEEDLKNISSLRNDKKVLKEVLRFREVVVFYDTKTFARKFVANDIFDIVFSMNYSDHGRSLYLFNAPNRKFRTSASGSGASRNGYIQVINAANGSVNRIIFSTNASEPIYKESAEGKYFATTSIEQKFYVANSVIIFDLETGSIVKNFVNDFRLSENTHIGRSTFEFLPDNKTIAMGYGHYLALWNFEK